MQDLRARLLNIHCRDMSAYTTLLMQGSGSFVVESVIGSMMPQNGKLLVLSNGAYGDRIAKIASYLKIDTVIHRASETETTDLNKLEKELENNPQITHVAVVHVETTTGIINPIEQVSEIVKKRGRLLFVDSMSGLGGIDMDIPGMDIDFIVSSANKCIQGVPGFGFAIVKKTEMEKCKGQARSYALDMYDQWINMENGNGKWRFTSPTHVVRAFYQALLELEKEGGIKAREKRYAENHRLLNEGIQALGFKNVIPKENQSHIITSYYIPHGFDFKAFYSELKSKGFVIYPGKLTDAETFRIGNIGEIYSTDIQLLLKIIKESVLIKNLN